MVDFDLGLVFGFLGRGFFALSLAAVAFFSDLAAPIRAAAAALISAASIACLQCGQTKPPGCIGAEVFSGGVCTPMFCIVSLPPRLVNLG